MKCLRLLILQIEHNFEGLEYLSNELRYLEWREYPFKSFPSTFQPNKLVELHMPHSNLKNFLKAIKPVESLKIINLSFSTKLIKTPDFSKFPNLEELNLQGCTKLVEVHQSIGVLTRLVSLNMQDCKNLVNLPDGVWNLQSLEIVNLGGCSKLLKRLGLVARQMWCFTAFPSLMHLDLSYCNLPEGAIPNDMSCLQLLEYLNLSGNPILSIPSSICQLSKLKGLYLYDCTELKTLPDLPSNIERLSTSNCTSLRTLPPLVQLCKLENFQCSNCKSLQSVPDLPSSVQHLKMENCTALETLPNLFEKHNVEKNFFISFSNCSKLKYCQSKISVGFTWLRSYLLWLYEVRKLLKLQESSPSEAEFEENFFLNEAKIILQTRIPAATSLPCFYICFPGSTIPEWFKYQGEEGELRIKLPPDEDWGKIAGFAVCCVVEDGNVIKDNEWQIAVVIEGKQVSCWGNRVPAGASQVTSDHLSLFFQVNFFRFFQVNNHRESNRECTPTELLLNFWPEGKIKNCGIRIVHDEEIEEMIRLNKALEDMGKVEEEDN
ncbi:disease resistance protein RUN1 isoform X2 [Manihot esculenta]|nr:disease resistance protein RUN1 isoform X2 [Manihot esculenta]KAG8639895.1 hypothetical protein MANES_13G002671v8 [Manihot esculenta]